MRVVLATVALLAIGTESHAQADLRRELEEIKAELGKLVKEKDDRITLLENENAELKRKLHDANFWLG
jgi:predicted nuclease with TOPRIM domain